MGCGRVLKIPGWSIEGGLLVNCTLLMFMLDFYGKNGVLVSDTLWGM